MKSNPNNKNINNSVNINENGMLFTSNCDNNNKENHNLNKSVKSYLDAHL